MVKGVRSALICDQHVAVFGEVPILKGAVEAQLGEAHLVRVLKRVDEAWVPPTVHKRESEMWSLAVST